jgi:hypothetical protein
VVARAQGAHFARLALFGTVGHELRFGVRHAALFLDAHKIGWAAVALVHCPSGAAGQHFVHGFAVQDDPPPAAEAGRNLGEQLVCQFHLLRLHCGPREASQQTAHPTGDVESDPAGRNDAPFGRVEGGDPADWKAVAPMGVRHGVGAFDDTGQRGDVNHLLADLLVHIGDQRPVGIDDPGDAHRAAPGDAPLEGADLIECGHVHPLIVLVAFPWPCLRRRPRIQRPRSRPGPGRPAVVCRLLP